jgi:hypothetical protein
MILSYTLAMIRELILRSVEVYFYTNLVTSFSVLLYGIYVFAPKLRTAAGLHMYSRTLLCGFREFADFLWWAFSNASS